MAIDNIRAIKINCGFCKRLLPLVLCNHAINTISPYFSIIVTAILLDEIVAGIPSVYRFAILVGVLLVGGLIISALSQALGNACSNAYEKLENGERHYLGNKYMRCQFRVIESEEFYKLQHTIDENQRINGAGRNLLLRSFQNLIAGFFSLLLAIVLFLELFLKICRSSFDFTAVIFIALIIALAVINIRFSKYKQKKNLEMSGVIGDMMTDEGCYDDAIDSYQIGKDVRLYGLASLIMDFKKKYLLDDHKKNFKWMMSKNFRLTIPEVITSFLLKFTIYTFIIFYVTRGVLTVGSIIKYVGLVELIIGAIRTIILNVSAVKDNTPHVSEYLKQFDLPEENHSGECEINRSVPLHWEFVNVSFRYDGSDTWALRHINLHIDSKTWYTIIGENGSGKTTLIKLLCRLYPPTEGTILLSGSTSVAPLMEELATAYMEINPHAAIQVEPSDSTKGLNAAMAGTCNFGMASRDLKDYEIELLDYTVIAQDHIAVIVHPENPVENLTPEILKEIYTGNLKNWEEINTYGRE